LDLPYDRGCWHGISQSLFVCYRHNRHRQKQFTTRRPSSCTRRCSVRLSPIAENSLLLPPVGVWAVLSPSQADHPLRPANDRRLGKPLPYQLANHTQAAPKALKALIRRPHAVLDPVSRAYPSLWGTFLRVTLPSAARVFSHHTQLFKYGVRTLPLDLHVLGTPPAFILSQDQTLHKKNLFLNFSQNLTYLF
jgi:hypothetical protein